MPSGKTRRTRRLRSWMVEQVSSGKYRGLVWDDDEKTMFRIPWKHAAKHDFRSDEDAAIFKAWAEFKGKLSENDSAGPASWKTRLRCALNKSPEFKEVIERSQLDISEPYKVYRLVPLDEQDLPEVKNEEEEKNTRRGKYRKRRRNSEINEEVAEKWIKEEEEAVAVQSISTEVDTTIGNGIILHPDEPKEHADVMKNDEVIDEIHFNLTVETVPPPGNIRDCPSFLIRVYYLGEEVLMREVMSDDVRIAFVPPSPSPPSTNGSSFLRVPLPPPPSSLKSDQIKSISTLLPFMDGGVILTTSSRGVYAKRVCQGRVFWRGPHALTNTASKMERGVKPTLIFNRQFFKQELDQFRSGGKEPETETTFCFGEELLETDDVSKKLIIIKITLPWAEKQIKDIAWTHSISLLQSLAQQSPSGEITLSLVELPEPTHTML
ncbi:interferon regulatory factor 9 isoform 2-T5 [Clarias gariepinus]|nr:interferon regulatory factor 9 isoform X2 [Clarias gariepinus]XP_053367014.1 interferon regulatory factor 9 isoform X2 [Clarias gariepinus]XP_053367015.1 interferon regulatory factor 9 isoform X2 [Clarias gariepinus]XP_053367016.1 interferon regulatory factor 9 isoform X2 [Clarias gariepinus]